MTNRRVSRKSPGTQKHGARQTPRLTPLPRWRWWVYLGVGITIFGILFVRIGGGVPEPITSFAAWHDFADLTSLAISGVFTGLIVALIKIFFDPVFLGIAQRKSKLLIAEELGVFVTQVAVGVAAEGLLSAAASAGSDRDAPSGGITSGEGGDFGGGGASGKF